MSANNSILVWYRNDLRLTDNAALHAAAAAAPVLPVFILEQGTDDPWPLGGASRWWLHHSLAALDHDLTKRGAPLLLRRGDPLSVLLELCAAAGARAVYWNNVDEPHGRQRDARIAEALTARGIEVRRFPGATLYDPAAIATGSGEPYTIFSPFWRACTKMREPGAPLPAPAALTPAAHRPAGEPLAAFELLPKFDWAGGLNCTWVPGEIGAAQRLADFLNDGLGRYSGDRDRPDLNGTSGLSPHLRWGEVSVRQVWTAVRIAQQRTQQPNFNRHAESYLREIGWREFGHYLIHHFPHLPTVPLTARFERFPWANNPASLKAWQQGRTGYPIVDAGMRELWQTGWMHNRLRMVVGSFLVKHLLLPWQDGARWFWDTLVDADLANNSAGWQWVTGCGVDSAPYFRIFNPILQGERHDPEGHYVRQFLPELAGLSTEWIHKPWQAPLTVLKSAGVILGQTYPSPIVDHGQARNRALAAFQTIQYDARRRA